MTLEEVYDLVRKELCMDCSPELKDGICDHEETCKVFEEEIRETIANNGPFGVGA